VKNSWIKKPNTNNTYAIVCKGCCGFDIIYRNSFDAAMQTCGWMENQGWIWKLVALRDGSPVMWSQNS